MVFVGRLQYRFMVAVSVLIALLCSSVQGDKVHGYLAARVYCGIASQTITVSLAPQTTTCFELIKELNVREDSLEADVARALGFMQNGVDVEYRESVFQQLRLQQQHLATLKNNISLSLRSFERDLFRKIHSLVRFQLQNQRIDLFALLDSLDEDITAAKQHGDTPGYVGAIRKKEAKFMEVLLLDAIFFARDFDALLPALHQYLLITSRSLTFPPSPLLPPVQ